MKSFTDSLLSEIENSLNSIHMQIHEPLPLSEEAIKILIVALEKLKSFFIKHKFQSKTEEIIFFREIKPQFAGKLIHYNEIYNIETRKPLGSPKLIRKYYNSEIQKLKTYFDENLDFYKYYRTGNRYLDNKYFIRGQHDIKLTLDSFYLQADHRFSTSHDCKVAMILANDMTRIYLENKVSKLDVKSKVLPVHNKKNQKWTGSKVALIELIYALHAEGIFNNGTSDLKELATFFETIFNVNLGQFNRTFLEIRSRKFERTKFLNTLKEKLMVRMDTADAN